MPIEPVNQAEAVSIYADAPARTPRQVMDGEMFMSLLVTQLRNQDPSAPMDTNEMIAQTTQLAMMEKLNQLGVSAAENFSLNMRSSAADLLGREVTYQSDAGKPVTGTATSVSYAGPVPQVMVGGTWTSLDSISGIGAGTVAGNSA